MGTENSLVSFFEQELPELARSFVNVGNNLPVVIETGTAGIPGAVGRLVLALRVGCVLEESSRVLLLTALEKYLHDGIALEVGLGISGHAGQRRARTMLLHVWRDAQLRIALGAVRLAEGERDNPTARARRLLKEINRFERVQWREWREYPDPPAGSSELRRALFRAKRTGLALPTSEKQMVRITDTSGPYSCPPEPATLPLLVTNIVTRSDSDGDLLRGELNTRRDP